MATDSGQQVLFVEDEVFLRDVVSTGLREEGFLVVEAGSGEEALEILRQRGAGIDWLFTDIRLPGTVDGWHVAFEFRFHHPLRPVIYATGYELALPPAVAGSVFLRKPYRIEDVSAALKRLGGPA